MPFPHSLFEFSCLFLAFVFNWSQMNPVSNKEPLQGRYMLFNGFPGEEFTEGVKVTLASKNVLESNLTTVFLPIIYIIVFVVGLPTNVMAIWVFLFRTKKKHPASILMANLALADLLFIIWLPLKISYHFNGNNWIFGEPLCKVLVGFFYGNMYCSTIFIACISVQRYWAIVHPLSQKLDIRAMVWVSLCVWVIVWLITTPLYLYKQTVKIININITTCHDVTRPSQSHIPVGYFLTMGILGYVIPSVVCIVTYALILNSLNSSALDSTNSKKKRKAIVLMINVLILFLVCFTPSNITLMVHNSLLAADIKNDAYGFYIFVLCLSSLNSCVDPFVYYFISEEFRSHVRNTLRCRSERTAKRMMIPFTSMKFSKKLNVYHPDSARTQTDTDTSDFPSEQSNIKNSETESSTC